jgi:hypothetical protein
VTGATGVFSGTVNQPTAVWQPTGAVSGSYDVTSWLAKGQTISGGVTNVMAIFPAKSGYVTSVLANILGFNGVSGCLDLDLKATFQSLASGPVLTQGPNGATNTVAYQSNNLGASGWNGILQPTGTYIALVVSTPAAALAGQTGTVNWSAMLQINERGFP